MVLQTFLVLLLFASCSVQGGRLSDDATVSLSGHKEGPRGRSISLEVPPDHLPERRKRATDAHPPEEQGGHNNNDHIYTKLNFLKDSHTHLMVHWVGEGSNVIICLARDPENTPHPINSSSVYISFDYGDNYTNKTEEFKLEDGRYSTIEKFYNHPKYNTHFVFTDVTNKLLFVTWNHGRNISRIRLDFTPSDLSFHEFQPQIFIILDKTDSRNKLWITEDYGQTFRLLQEYVKTFFWIQDKRSQQQLVVQRQEPSNLTTIFYSNASYKYHKFNIYATEIKDVYIKGNYIFYTMKNKKDSYDLYVSYKLGKRIQCYFDTDLDLRGYHIADVTGNRALVAISHTNTLSHLYVSENLGGSEDKVRFTLSLPSVLCYFPNSTWKDSWLHRTSEDAFADVYKVEGPAGIYIASQVAYKPQGGNFNLGPQHLVSRITFDHGATWRPIVPPQKDMEGQLISCSMVEQNCSLHLSQRFSYLYPDTRSISILSSKSAPGIIVATGVIGKTLKGHFGVYISIDSGITWRQSLRDLYFFNMGDHGGILTAVKYLKMRGETRHILYSTDEGENWMESSFHNEEIRLYGLMTEPGENTTVFTMFGSLPDMHQWIIVKMDLRNVFKYNCTADDYKSWSPSRSGANQRYVPCVMGQQLTFKRRIPHANCYNGLDFDHPISMEACDCDRDDYECDFGFVNVGNPSHCVRNKSVDEDPYQVPSVCRHGETYNRTKGYRKIPGDKCINGFEKQYLPDIIHCPVETVPNQLIFAQRERIFRLNLNSNHLKQLQVPNLQNVIAIDFDLDRNHLYYADIVSDTIGRIDMDGRAPSEILVSTELISVEGMALDWVSKNLYFVDGLRAKIELIRTDIHHSGRMRRTVLASKDLVKPRGIVLHPVAGYMFWTDWASENPSVNRANLDGTNVARIAQKPVVEWPNGITIDYIAERVYWVDAREDYIGSSDYFGEKFKKVPIANDFVSHPFAVAVFKDDLYWDDWKRNSIFTTNKDHGGVVGTLVSNVSGLMDLKVIAHGVQIGKNPCSKNPCPYICVGSPTAPNYVCLCPDGMTFNMGKCLCPGGFEPYGNATCQKIDGSCPDDYFECGNGVCVPKLWRCDKEDDCGDGSDERECKTETCAAHYFVCGDGKCLPHYWRCDYEKDCADGSDELNCPKSNCTISEFTCENGRCISTRWKCDGQNDCRDGSDERDCFSAEPATCKADEFKCTTGGMGCIPLTWKCDGENDCKDNSDEASCGNNTCAQFQFSCGAPGNKCIYDAWVCDGDKDCPNGADEANCTATTQPAHPAEGPKNLFPPMTNGTTCQDFMFTCANKKCIPVWWKCDGANDCEDHSDEVGCGKLSGTSTQPSTAASGTWSPHVCSQNQFQCASGECIALAWVCDKSQDCMDGEDETNCEGVHPCDQKDQFKCKMDGNCIAVTDVCNGHSDCPDGSDEAFCTTWHNLPSGPAEPSCSYGYFPCDINSCYPLASMCDGKADCVDGTDEDADCLNTERVYQVLQMGVDERGIDDSSLLLFWWIPIPDSIVLEFMPAIAEVKVGNWENKTWMEKADYRFTGLKPYTEYNMTVYVRVKHYDAIFPPAKYFTATTGEGVPSGPWNLTLEQNGSDVLISWNKPIQPNGVIQFYEISWSPPLVSLKLSDNSTAHLLTADFRHNQKYTFHVAAYNHLRKSEISEIKSIVFDADSVLEAVIGLKISARTTSSISLVWQYSKSVEGFNVAVTSQESYPIFPSVATKTNNITIENLPPASNFRFHVNAFKKSFKGPVARVQGATEGERLPEVTDIRAEVLKDGTSVNVSWHAPKDAKTKNIQWLYGVYHGLTWRDAMASAPLKTTGLTATISNLQACEKYIFNVGVVGPAGTGPVSHEWPSVTTSFNHRAPPERVTAQQEPDNHLQMCVQWSPSCPTIDQPIGYVLRINDTARRNSRTISLLNSTSQELSRNFNVTYGGVYTVEISTNVPGAIFSAPVTYRAPPIMPPYEITVMPQSNGSYVVYWHERVLPESIGPYTYEILVSEGNRLNKTTAMRHESPKSPFVFHNESADMYSFAVQLKTSKGYRSILSEVTSSTKRQFAWRKEVETNSLTPILVPICLLLVVLGAALTFYVVKYRRLQTSFTRFANSHYDTRSEAATFDDQGLDEDNSPQIRGFSDDEPLVIA